MTPDPLPDRLSGYALDHVAVAVADLDAADAWTTLGLRVVADDEEVPEQGVRVRVLETGGALLELLAPTSASSPVARFLASRGPGLHHVALRVADLDLAMAELTAAGLRFVDAAPRRGRAGTRVAFLHPDSAHGTLVELVEHP